MYIEMMETLETAAFLFLKCIILTQVDFSTAKFTGLVLKIKATYRLMSKQKFLMTSSNFLQPIIHIRNLMTQRHHASLFYKFMHFEVKFILSIYVKVFLKRYFKQNYELKINTLI